MCFRCGIGCRWIKWSITTLALDNREQVPRDRLRLIYGDVQTTSAASKYRRCKVLWTGSSPSLADKSRTRQHAKYSREGCQVTGNQHHKTLSKMAKTVWEHCLHALKKAWALALRVKSAWLARWEKNAFNSVWTLALKPEITVTRVKGKIKMRWWINAMD